MVAGLIGAIVLAGIVMLVIWKIATSIHDRREFAKFENERQAAMFDAVSDRFCYYAKFSLNRLTFCAGTQSTVQRTSPNFPEPNVQWSVNVETGLDLNIFKTSIT